MAAVRADDTDYVERQYRRPANLQARIAVWEPAADGRTPGDVALAAVAEVAPARVLEVGCGTGAFAARLRDELGVAVVAVDASPAMVACARGRGVDARAGDVQRLAFADGTFDCAVAAWVLYHVPDLAAALAELARVLRPTGRLVAVTNGDAHLAELWAATGIVPRPTTFSRQTGDALLGRWFARVARHDLQTRAVFADRAAAARYLASLGRADADERVRALPEPFTARGTPTVFVADRPRRPPSRRAGARG